MADTLTPGAEHSVGPPKQTFFSGLAEVLSVVMPYLMAFRFFTLELPPWAEDMRKTWGVGFIILGTVIFLILRYVPRHGLGNFIHAQEQQVYAMTTIAYAVQEINKEGGQFATQNAKLEQILLNMARLLERVRVIEARVLSLKLLNGDDAVKD